MATKKGTGLQPIMGQADNSLIQASYRMAMANVPKDLNPMFKRIGDSMERGMMALGQGFGTLVGASIKKGVELHQKAKEEGNDPLEGFSNGGGGEGIGNKIKGFFGKITDFVEDVFDGGGIGGVGEEKAKDITERRDKRDNVSGETSDNNIYKNSYNVTNHHGNLVESQSFSMEDAINDVRINIGRIRKDKTLDKSQKKKLIAEQKEIRNNIKNSASSFAQTSIIIDDHLENSNFNMSPANAKNFDFLSAIKRNGEADEFGNKAVQTFDKKGNMYFTYVDANGEAIINPVTKRPYSVDSKQAKNLITVVYDEGRNYIEEEGIKAATTRANAPWTDATTSEVMRGVVIKVKNDINNFNDMKAYPVPGAGGKTATLEEYLSGAKPANSVITTEMWASLANDKLMMRKLGVEDKNNDGPTKDDFVTEENYAKLVNAIIDHENPAFNLDLSTKILARFTNDQNKSLHNAVWSQNPLNPNSPNFKPPSGAAGTYQERQEANTINSFLSQVNSLKNQNTNSGSRRLDLPNGDVLHINKSGSTYDITRTYFADDKTDVASKESLTIDQAFTHMSKSGLLARNVLSDVYQMFKQSENKDYNLANLIGSEAFKAKDDERLIGALQQVRQFKGRFEFSNPSNYRNSIKIKVVGSDKEQTFDVSDKDGMQKFLNENRIVQYT